MKHRFIDTKPFGEHLSPLYGIIRKNVGRRWDKVYGELKQAFDTRSATGNHIFQHLYDQLANPSHTKVIDGKVTYFGRWLSGPTRIADTHYEYYVDPRDGILKRNRGRISLRESRRRREAAKAAALAAVRRIVSDTVELHKIDGVWFEVQFRNQELVYETYADRATNTLRRTASYPYAYDVLQKQTVKCKRVAISKRTISHRELKRYDLVG